MGIGLVQLCKNEEGTQPILFCFVLFILYYLLSFLFLSSMSFVLFIETAADGLVRSYGKVRPAQETCKSFSSMDIAGGAG